MRSAECQRFAENQTIQCDTHVDSGTRSVEKKLVVAASLTDRTQTHGDRIQIASKHTHNVKQLSAPEWQWNMQKRDDFAAVHAH